MGPDQPSGNNEELTTMQQHTGLSNTHSDTQHKSPSHHSQFPLGSGLRLCGCGFVTQFNNTTLARTTKCQANTELENGLPGGTVCGGDPVYVCVCPHVCSSCLMGVSGAITPFSTGLYPTSHIPPNGHQFKLTESSRENTAAIELTESTAAHTGQRREGERGERERRSHMLTHAHTKVHKHAHTRK